MQAHIVVGLGFGDEGKGSWVDHLVRTRGLNQIVRFNGGAQALHHVVTPDGQVHGFSQFGSGMFVPGTKTLLSRFMLLDPDALLKEADALLGKGVMNPLGRLIVSENAPVITPMNRLLNRMQEIARGGARHGSCGFGIGLTQADVETLGDGALYVRDLPTAAGRRKLFDLWEQKRSVARQLATAESCELLEQFETLDLDYYAELFAYVYHRASVVTEAEFQALVRSNDSVFEGAQGVLLDQVFGFFPHCTRSTCTFGEWFVRRW